MSQRYNKKLCDYKRLLLFKLLFKDAFRDSREDDFGRLFFEECVGGTLSE